MNKPSAAKLAKQLALHAADYSNDDADAYSRAFAQLALALAHAVVGDKQLQKTKRQKRA